MSGNVHFLRLRKWCSICISPNVLMIMPHSKTSKTRMPTWDSPHFQFVNGGEEVQTDRKKRRYFLEAFEPQMLVLVIKRGQLLYETPASNRSLQPETIALVPQPSQTTIQLGRHCQSSTWLWLTFKGSLALDAFNILTRRYGFIYPALNLKKLLPVFNRLIAQSKKSEDPHEISKTAFATFHDLWTEVETCFDALPAMENQPPAVSAVLAANCVTFGDYAQKLGYSPSHLSRTLRKAWGKPPGATMRALRLDKAARMLRESDLQVNEVAFQVGYQSTSSFIRAFTTRFLKTPANYRRHPGSEE